MVSRSNQNITIISLTDKQANQTNKQASKQTNKLIRFAMNTADVERFGRPKITFFSDVFG